MTKRKYYCVYQILLQGQKLMTVLKEKGTYDNYRKKLSANTKKRIKENGHWWVGKKHTEETKQKLVMNNVENNRKS